MQSLSYSLDAQDIIVSVGSEYDEYCEAQRGRLKGIQVIGRPIWNFVEGEALKLGLSRFFSQARLQPGWLPYRCDSPTTLRRWRVDGKMNGGNLEVTFSEQESRERPTSPKRNAPAARPIHFCSWCNGIFEGPRIRWHGRAEADELAGMLLFSPSCVKHILCPLCESALEQLDPQDGFEHLQDLGRMVHPILNLTLLSPAGDLPRRQLG
jgi:hypothetical protein